MKEIVVGRLKRHVTYANVISTLCLFLLLGGAGALAAKKSQKIGSTQIKASAVTTAKIKNAAVDASKLKDGAVTSSKLASGSVLNAKIQDGAVSTGKIADNAVTGAQVEESTLSEVPSANSANPGVFARINASSTVDAVNSKGITSPNVSHPATGVYCITIPGFTPRGGQVTTQGGSGTSTAQLSIGGTAKCAAPGAQVSIWNTEIVPAAADFPFFVELYR